MKDLKLGIVEMHFAEIIWENEPVSSGELVSLCNQELKWKKSTTYTVLKKLCEKGLFQNVEGVVSALVSKTEYQARQCEQFVEETFEGSLPQFLAAFSSRKRLSDKEIAEIQRIIAENER